MFHHNLTRAQYDAIPAINHSLLKHIDRSPAHLQYARRTPFKPTPAMKIGLLEDHLLFGTEWAYEVSPWKNFRTQESQAWRDQREAADVHVVTMEQMDATRLMLDNVRRNPVVQQHLASGHPQVCLTERLCDVECKGLADWLPARHSIIWDLKTTDDASADQFRWKLKQLDYDAQAYFYAQMARLTTGDDWRFGWIVVESEPPHHVATYVADNTVMESGRQKIERRLTIYKQCLDTDHWPAYPEELILIGMPGARGAML